MIAQKTAVPLVVREMARQIRFKATDAPLKTAEIGLRLLRRMEPVNGEAKDLRRAAKILANSLKVEYENPKQAMQAATVAEKLRALAREYEPMVDTVCLS